VLPDATFAISRFRPHRSLKLSRSAEAWRSPRRRPYS
jgi:hypothetical protein